MKATIRVPTEQYAFIEQEIEVEGPEAAVEAYRALQRAYKGGEGVSTKDFNAALDRYLKDGDGETETYIKMNKDQQRVFQEIKKSLRRIKTI